LFTCPNCTEKGIGFWSKLWSGSNSPSECKSCGKLSYVHSKYRFGFQSGWPTLFKFLGAGLSLFLLFQTNNVFSLFLFPLIWLACSYWELSSLPMRPISETHVAVAKKSGNLFIVGLIIVFGLVWVVSNL
jgi:hypothetical protein